MLSMNSSSASDFAEFGRELFVHFRDTLNTFEDAAQVWVKHVYEGCVGPDGNPAFALVRVFKVEEVAYLPDELRAHVPADDAYALALAGTYGDEPEWCDRHLSNSHQILSLDSASAMLQAAMRHVGLTWGEAAAETLVASQDASLSKFFFVEDPESSPYITDKDNFVHPYRIKSVLGMGAPFISRRAYLALAFSRVPIDDACRQHFMALLPFTSTLLAAYDGREKKWN